MERILGDRGWKIFEIISVGLLLALSLNLLIIFFPAYFSGLPVLVNINAFSEAHIEAVLFPIWFVMGVVTIVRMVKSIGV